MTKFKIFYNPKSRDGKSKKDFEKVKEALKATSLDYDIEETISSRSGIEQARKAKDAGFDTVIALGGDGTVSEIANGAIQAGLKFGVIPVGSGNDFAYGIGIDSWEKGIEVLQNGKTVSISMLNAGDYYSVNIIDAGLGADVVKLSETKLRWMAGQLKYTLLVMRGLVGHKRYSVRITVDGISEEYDLNILAMGFGQTFGSGMRVLPDARYTHEKMQIAIVHSVSRIKFLWLFPKVFSGKHIHVKKHVKMLSGHSVEVELLENNRELWLEAEGELFGMAPRKIEVVRNGVEVLTPKDWDPSNTSNKV